MMVLKGTLPMLWEPVQKYGIQSAEHAKGVI